MIREIFYSIQGEGILAGTPAVFVCLSDGPARPTWCAAPEGNFQPTGETTLGGLLANCRKHWASYAVVTGGEPLAVGGLSEVIEGLQRFDHHVTIETSGAIYAEVPCNLLSINTRLQRPAKKPKGPQAAGYDIDILRKLAARYDYQLKFVVNDRSELEEVKGVAQEIGAEKTKVLLIPGGSKAKELNDQSLWMVEAARFFGYRYAPRLVMPVAPKKPAGTP